eukprot:scaffold94990_cov58-Phaeocystis_antarctica.AAC.1
MGKRAARVAEMWFPSGNLPGTSGLWTVDDAVTGAVAMHVDAYAFLFCALSFVRVKSSDDISGSETPHALRRVAVRRGVRQARLRCTEPRMYRSLALQSKSKNTGIFSGKGIRSSNRPYWSCYRSSFFTCFRACSALPPAAGGSRRRPGTPGELPSWKPRSPHCALSWTAGRWTQRRSPRSPWRLSSLRRRRPTAMASSRACTRAQMSAWRPAAWRPFGKASTACMAPSSRYRARQP